MSLIKCKAVCLFGVLLLLLSGCGYKDIDKRLFVVSIGVDQADNSSKKYLVSLKFALPAASKIGSNEFIIISQKADTMAEAVRVIKTRIDKELDFSHAKVLILSEDLARQKENAGLYYWLSRRRDIQKVAYVAIGKPSALDVLKVKPKSEELPANALILALPRDGTETPYVISAYYFDMKKRLIERGLDPILPVVKAKNDLLEINTAGIFNKSSLKLSLTQEETKLLNYILNREEKSELGVKKGKVKFIVDINKLKTKYHIYTPKGKEPFIKVDIKVKGRIEETNMRITNGHLSPYEKAANAQLTKEITALLKKIQKENLDPVGFGLRYRARHFNKNDWEEWKGIYPAITFKVNAKVNIEDTGLIE